MTDLRTPVDPIDTTNREEEREQEPETVSEQPEQEEAMYEVIIPENVQPNEYFTARAGDQRVLLKCPHNLVAGKRIRFKVPVSSSSPIEEKKVPSTINIKIRVSPKKKSKEAAFSMRDRIITAGSSVLFMLVVLHCYSSSLSFHQCIC